MVDASTSSDATANEAAVSETKKTVPAALVDSAALQRVACRSFQVNGAQVDVQRVLFGLVPWLATERCDVESISKGVVDLRDIFYFAVLIAASLYATTLVLGIKQSD